VRLREGNMALSILQMNCIELKLTTNLTQRQIADKLGINDETVSAYNRDPEYREEIAKRVTEKFSDLSTRAQQRLSSLLDSDSDKVALQAAKLLLDYSGFSPVQKQEITSHDIVIEIKHEDNI
jgi:transcriptional regulator with XRE-family HTH domain